MAHEFTGAPGPAYYLTSIPSSNIVIDNPKPVILGLEFAPYISLAFSTVKPYRHRPCTVTQSRASFKLVSDMAETTSFNYADTPNANLVSESANQHGCF